MNPAQQEVAGIKGDAVRRIKVSEASGAALNWLVAKCVVPNDPRDGRPGFWLHPNNPKLVCRISHNYVVHPDGYTLCLYSTDWSQGGPIIEQMRGIKLKSGCNPKAPCYAHIVGYNGVERWHQTGKTLLIAAMRCYVASKLGDEVEVPEELFV